MLHKKIRKGKIISVSLHTPLVWPTSPHLKFTHRGLHSFRFMRCDPGCPEAGCGSWAEWHCETDTSRTEMSCIPLEHFPPISPLWFLSAGRIVRSWALSSFLLPGLIGTLSGRESQQKGIFLFLLEGGVFWACLPTGQQCATGVTGKSVACTSSSELLWLRYYDCLSKQSKKWLSHDYPGGRAPWGCDVKSGITGKP